MGCKIARSGSRASILVTLILLAGCPAQPQRVPEVEEPIPGREAITREGRPYKIVPEESLLTILVFRGGPLARAGHNHVIASRDLSGLVYVMDPLERSSFELRFPVAKLTVDEEELRASEGAEFPPEVPESAKEGTRRNMLSDALLDAERFPEVKLLATGLEPAPGGFRAHVQVTVRDQTHSIVVPLRVEMRGDELLASGETKLKHSEIGLTPFSAMLGALQVQDEMTIRYRVTARARPDS